MGSISGGVDGVEVRFDDGALVADAGFFSYELIDTLAAHGARYSVTVTQNPEVEASIAAIDAADWAPIAYTRGGGPGR